MMTTKPLIKIAIAFTLTTDTMSVFTKLILSSGQWQQHQNMTAIDGINGIMTMIPDSYMIMLAYKC